MHIFRNVLILGVVIALAGCGKPEPAKDTAQPGATPQAGAPSKPAATQGGQTGNQGSAQAAQNKPATPVAAAPKAGGPDAVMTEAKQIFSVRCAVCHGQAGRGDGPGAAALQPKPRDYSDKAWQATVTDDEIRKVIVEGGQGGGKSVLMPPNPDLGQKPEVLNAMVKLIRSFAQ